MLDTKACRYVSLNDRLSIMLWYDMYDGYVVYIKTFRYVSLIMTGTALLIGITDKRMVFTRCAGL